MTVPPNPPGFADLGKGTKPKTPEQLLAEAAARRERQALRHEQQQSSMLVRRGMLCTLAGILTMIVVGGVCGGSLTATLATGALAVGLAIVILCYHLSALAAIPLFTLPLVITAAISHAERKMVFIYVGASGLLLIGLGLAVLADWAQGDES